MSISTLKSDFAFSARRAIATFLGVVAVTVLSSSVALAGVPPPTLDLTPLSAVNPVGTTHTVTATLNGYALCDSGSNVGAQCVVDADCFDQGPETCSKANIPVGFQVFGGPNIEDTAVNDQYTDSNGEVEFTYTGSGGPGVDTIQACAELAGGPDPYESTSECIGESGYDFTDLASNTVSKEWVTATLVLTPVMSYNLTGTTHTVKATLNGIAYCEGGTNGGSSCSVDGDCDSNACSREGIPVGFQVSGANTLDSSTTYLTDLNGQVEYTYTDTGGPGTDTIQACADSTFYDSPETTSECISENGGPTGDIASNVTSKVWGDINLALTPESAYNPVGTIHTVTATIAGVAKHCTVATGQPFVACTTDGDCGGAAGSCAYAGYPTFFAVIGECSGGLDGGEICSDDATCDSGLCSGGPNLGELLIGVTNAAGVATTSYSSTVEGEDKIQACLDGDPSSFGVNDENDPTLIGCINEILEADFASNVATKGWFANYITGGAGVNAATQSFSATNKSKKTVQFSGIVGKDSGLPGIHGQWNAVTKDSSGKTVSCHFDTFTKLVFSGPAATTPKSTHNTATWTTGPGKCNNGYAVKPLTATAVDTGEGKKPKPDTITVTGDPLFDTGGTKNLTTGNLQVHSIILP